MHRGNQLHAALRDYAGRVRKFGGSTGKKGWGGWCKPLSPVDFAERPWVPLSGWPITPETLSPYYAKASETLGIPLDHVWHPQAVGEATNSSILSEPCALAPWPFSNAA